MKKWECSRFKKKHCLWNRRDPYQKVIGCLSVGRRSYGRISYNSLKIACDRLLQAIFNLARMKKMCNSPLVTHYLQVNQCEDNNTLQLNQPHKQYNRVPIYITAETQHPHKSDYSRRLIEVPLLLRFQVWSAQCARWPDNYCRLNYKVYDLCNSYTGPV